MNKEAEHIQGIADSTAADIKKWVAVLLSAASLFAGVLGVGAHVSGKQDESHAKLDEVIAWTEEAARDICNSIEAPSE